MTNVIRELKEMTAIKEGIYRIEEENGKIKVVEVYEKRPTWEGNYAMHCWSVGGELKRYAKANGIEVVTIF